ncbi:hypothetical protein KUTeg_013090 [Tegillarca granosa]|uniref:Acyl-ACP thioesterase n=1 Tax=Tegillarca granosa TaxID=220873 RepID=A0ABQ9EW69_TEGGR|nr:hypothetical protein KUTeg_013090 [Tegillarca granosa]
MEVNEDKVEAIVHHPGMSYADYDVNGQPRLWNVMRMVGSARWYSHHYPLDESGRTFRDYAEMTSDRLTFMVTSEFIMTKKMYDHSIPKSPLCVKVQGGYIGNTSMNSIATVTTATSEIELIRNTNQIVSINKSTRRPSPLPDWWKEKYTESAKNHKSLKIDKFEKADNAGFYQNKVAWSDTDRNLHTNFSTYVRFCIDAAHHCAKEGTLKHFEENLKNGINVVQLHFYQESNEGDMLDVYCWEDPSNSKKIYFDIHIGEKSIFQSIMLLF